MSDYKYVSTKPLEEFEVVKKARTSGDSISRQDAIKVASNACGEFRGIFGRIEDGLRELPSAEPKQWVPCEERLPKIGEQVLLTVHEIGWNCVEYNRVIIGIYSDNYKDHILAWMPLPTPYKGETE